LNGSSGLRDSSFSLVRTTYQEDFTPRERWIDNLSQVLDPAVWDIGGRETDIKYEFLTYDRGGLRYSSQVVGARKGADGSAP